MGLTLTFFISLLFVGGTLITQEYMNVPLILGAVLGLQMFATILVSMGLPLLIGRLNFDPIVSGPSLSMIVSNVFSVGILVFYYAIW